MQNVIIKYGMDSTLTNYLLSDMPLDMIKQSLFNSYGFKVTNSDIEEFYKYDRDNELYQRYLKKSIEEKVKK